MSLRSWIDRVASHLSTMTTRGGGSVAGGDTLASIRRKAKTALTAAAGCFTVVVASCAGCVVIAQFIGGDSSAIKEADKLWAAGRKVEAVQKYEAHFNSVASSRKPEVLVRVVETRLEQGDAEAAFGWVDLGVRERIAAVYTSDRAKGMAGQARHGVDQEAKFREQEARRKAEERAADQARRQAERDAEGRSRTLTAGQLRQAYLTDPQAADAKYRGKTVQLTGRLSNLYDGTGDAAGEPVVVSVDEQDGPSVMCHFRNGRRNEVTSRLGQTVTLRGSVAEYVPGFTIRLRGCSLE